MSSPVEEIKDRLDILEVIQGYVRLQKAGANWKGLCPFHAEKTPSFTVSPEKQMWYCFGCGEGGDLFSFIQKIEGLEFADALSVLAERAGVRIKKGDGRLQSKRKQLYEVLELATKFFAKQLDSKTGQAVVGYLKERGLKETTIKDWRVGYAPDEWRGLYEFLSSYSYSDNMIEGTGLIIAAQDKKAKNQFHDRFRHRIMFPVFDIQGRVVGFSGRFFDKIPGRNTGKEVAKYINTPNTLVYDKSRVLYGLDKAKAAIKERASCIIVEGNTDVIMAHQAGTPNVVAVSGTALAEQHLKIIKRYTDKVLLCFDNDEAGKRATKRAAQIALRKDLNIEVVVLPAGKDAAELVNKDPKAWRKAVDSGVPFIQFVLEGALKVVSADKLEGKKAIAKEVLGVIKNVNSPVEQEHWVGELALKIGTSQQSLLEELRTLKSDSAPPYGDVVEIIQPTKEKDSSSGDASQLEEYLLTLLVRYPEGIEYLKDDIEFINDARIKMVLSNIQKSGEVEKELKQDARLGRLLLQAEFLEEIISDEEEEFLNVLGYLRKQNIRQKLKIIEADIKKAEVSDDTETVNLLLSQFKTLSQELISHENQKAHHRGKKI